MIVLFMMSSAEESIRLLVDKQIQCLLQSSEDASVRLMMESTEVHLTTAPLLKFRRLPSVELRRIGEKVLFLKMFTFWIKNMSLLCSELGAIQWSVMESTMTAGKFGRQATMSEQQWQLLARSLKFADTFARVSTD